MTLDEAILEAGRSVAAASPNLSVAKFHATVRSLVVTTLASDTYIAVTVDNYREHLANPPWPIVLVMGTPDTFGG